MAETSFAKLDHRVPVARAEVSRVGSGWVDPAARVDRFDATSHLPLSLPGGLQAPPLEAPPPPPSEAELRETLAQCIASKAFVDEQLARARATADRGHEHVESCRARVDAFASLEDEATQHTIEALRGGAGRLDQDDGLRKRRIEREIARDDLAAAQRAASVLDTAALEARVDADHALEAARAAAVAVAAITAEQMARGVLELADQLARERVALLGFDRIAASTKQPLPPVVFEAIGADNPELLKPIDVSAWRAAIDQLLGDAMAQIEVAIPERNRPPPLPRFSPEIRYAVPIRRPEPTQESEIETPAETEAAP